MCHTSFFLLFCILPLCLFNSTLLCILYTIYYTTTPCSGTLAFGFSESLYPYNHIPYTLQKSPLLLVSSTLPCILLLPLEVALLLYYAPSPSSIFCVVAPPLLFSSLFLLDTPISCVPPFHIRNTSLSVPLPPVSLLPSLYTT